MDSTFLTIIEILGTIAFAISGIRLASAKKFDWFGAYVVGLVTAIGGGTIRDVMLGCTPFWMLNSIYLAVTGISLLSVIIFGKYLIRLQNTFFYLRYDRTSFVCRCRDSEIVSTRLSFLGSHCDGYDYRFGRRCFAGYLYQRGPAYFPERYICHGVCHRWTFLLGLLLDQFG